MSDDCRITNTESETLTNTNTAEKPLGTTYGERTENRVTTHSFTQLPSAAANSGLDGSEGAPAATRQAHPALSESVEASVSSYLSAMSGQDVNGLYELVLSEIEAPMLTVLMKHTGRNQSQASEMLGLNRGTLRKKLKKYGLI